MEKNSTEGEIYLFSMTELLHVDVGSAVRFGCSTEHPDPQKGVRDVNGRMNILKV